MEKEDHEIMMTPTLPTWKLYDNPHYSCRRHHNSPQHQNHAYICLSKSRSSYRTSDLTAFSMQYPMLDSDLTLSDLDNALAEIKDLRSELDFERRIRRKVEALNSALTWQLAEERRKREDAEEACRKLMEEITCARREAEVAAEEVEEERRMLRMAELMREERVQMKMTDARILMEEKMKEMESGSGEGLTVVDGNTRVRNNEVENPHIKRGMKGMVEFPKAVRIRVRGNGSPGSREGRGRELGWDLECQRAQLRVLIRNRNPVGSGLMGGNTGEGLVM